MRKFFYGYSQNTTGPLTVLPKEHIVHCWKSYPNETYFEIVTSSLPLVPLPSSLQVCKNLKSNEILRKSYALQSLVLVFLSL